MKAYCITLLSYEFFMDTLRIKSSSFTCLDGVGTLPKIFLLEDGNEYIILCKAVIIPVKQD